MWAVAGLWTGLLLTGFNAYAAAVTYIPQFRVRNDFRLIYVAALTAWRQGYSHLYELDAQKRTVEGLGEGTYWSPFLNPPPLAWLATPFIALPFEAAIFVWTLLVVGADCGHGGAGAGPPWRRRAAALPRGPVARVAVGAHAAIRDLRSARPRSAGLRGRSHRRGGGGRCRLAPAAPGHGAADRDGDN